MAKVTYVGFITFVVLSEANVAELGSFMLNAEKLLAAHVLHAGNIA